MHSDFSWKPLNWHRLSYDDLKVGWERTWEIPITFESVAWYADLAEDPNHWYSFQGSPWGPPVAPPLLMSRLCSRITDPLGRMMGFLNTYNRTFTFEPALVGTMGRFHGRVTEKFEKNGRQYVRYEIDVTDAATGKKLLHEEKEYIATPQAKEEKP
jgi:hypothetical protein